MLLARNCGSGLELKSHAANGLHLAPICAPTLSVTLVRLATPSTTEPSGQSVSTTLLPGVLFLIHAMAVMKLGLMLSAGARPVTYWEATMNIITTRIATRAYAAR